jgi:acetolactate synthase-1/2/3 large subunit
MTRCSSRDEVKHVLVRHEQGAVHAAEGYARSTGKPGVRPGHLRSRRDQCGHRHDDALMDSIPIVVITGQVADPSDRHRRLPGMRHHRHHAPCTKHNYLVKTSRPAAVMHEAFHIATSGRPGPVVIDIPKDVQFAKGAYSRARTTQHTTTRRAPRAIRTGSPRRRR